LRTADRVLLKLAQFEAKTFNELFDAVFQIDWFDFLPIDANFSIHATSNKSQLHSCPAIQSITQKAIFKKLQKKYSQNHFSQIGPKYEIFIKIEKDQCLIGLNTSGQSLHKRGYRKKQSTAPIKETLAAAMVNLSEWNQNNTLLDPFCGSGTIPIEAALIAKNIPPGLNRSYDFLKWKHFLNIEQLKEIFHQARSSADYSQNIKIYGSDYEKYPINIATDNAEKANVSDIIFTQTKFEDIDFSKFENLTIISNPPYGERMNEISEVRKISKKLGEIFKLSNIKSLNIITASETFEEDFALKANKNRKLYNGKIKCYFYQYSKS
ncbi:class I SAM-dependent RNA methyltransferase, partial [Candidatus Peregrinibacteria bacterium]|nr:class I SAM-dependent RNA methyltransferase [Candidatus Peregrinibacteria bacterium]